MERRNFLKQSTMASLALTGIGKASAMVKHGETSIEKDRKKILMRIGICADLHHDLISDGERRIQVFINEMNNLQPDFILQMGDFCVPKEKNRPLMDIWNQFKGPKYHVIGNHDRDGGFTLQQLMDFWEAKGAYYSFDCKGYHFVVLNGNERPTGDTSKGYPRSVTKTQRQWMKNDIAATSLPVIIFCHQGIDNDMDGVVEGNLLRVVFEKINKEAGFNKIQMVFSGHHHENYYNPYNNIHYIQVNSISYQFWHTSPGYGFAHCKDPLWALLTIYDNGTAEIKGKKSEYEGGRQEWENAPDYDGYPTVACISDRLIKL